MMGYVPDPHKIWVGTSEFPVFYRYALIMEEASEAGRTKAGVWANTIHALGMTLLLGSITLFRKVTQGNRSPYPSPLGRRRMGKTANHFFGIAVLASQEPNAAQFQTSVNHAGCHLAGTSAAH